LHGFDNLLSISHSCELFWRSSYKICWSHQSKILSFQNSSVTWDEVLEACQSQLYCTHVLSKCLLASHKAFQTCSPSMLQAVFYLRKGLLLRYQSRNTILRHFQTFSDFLFSLYCICPFLSRFRFSRITFVSEQSWRNS